MSAVAAGSERSGLDRLRWPLCLLVVLGIHGVAVLRLREIRPTTVAMNAPPAVSLDLAPLPAPPTVVPTPPAPAPVEPPPPVAPPPEPAPLPPEPEAVLPDPLPPPVVQPEVALPRPVPPKRPPPVRHTVQKPPQPVAPVADAPVAAPVARPAQAAAPQTAAAPGAAAASWESALAAYLARFKRYPVSAQRRGEQGVAQVRFSVDRNGMAHGVTLFRSSGHADLDAEAESLVERAQPLPVPPADMAGVASDVVIPVHFSLH